MTAHSFVGRDVPDRLVSRRHSVRVPRYIARCRLRRQFPAERRSRTSLGPCSSEIGGLPAGKSVALNAAEKGIAENADTADLNLVSVLSAWSFLARYVGDLSG